MKKRFILLFLISILFNLFMIYAQTRPSGDPPSPYWSPRPTTIQSYLNGICGGGDSYWQEWCAWLTQHPGDIPISYYTPNTCTPNWQCTQWNSCTNNQQTRTCSDDSNCNVMTGKPSESQFCSTSNLTVTISEFKSVLIESIKDYFTNPDNAKLNTNELKDLITAYFSTSGNTIDLSRTGSYSKEKLINIYNKAKGNSEISCSSENKMCGGIVGIQCCSGLTCKLDGNYPDASGRCIITQNKPSGPLGSKTNPIPMNKGPYRGNVYHASTADEDGFTPVSSQKTWFVVDAAFVVEPKNKFYFVTQGFNNPDLFYTKVIQDRAGNDLKDEINLPQNTGDTQFSAINNQPYNFNTTRFLFSIEDRSIINFGKPTVRVQFMP